MNLAAIDHQPTRAFVLPLARTRLSFRLLAARGDLRECLLIYWKRNDPYPASRREAALALRYRSAQRDDFRAAVSFVETAHYIRYFFKLRGADGQEMYLSEYGFTVQPPADGFFEFLYANDRDVLQTPDWAKGVVYYQIFPDRYAVGNPKKALHAYEPWESVPTAQNFLGGDLAGIRARLPYLADLGIGCLYLTPIFRADYNHKYATIDYYSIDPDFGTEEDLRALVQGAHALGMRVLLDGVFNHTGVHFPPFEDVLRKGEASEYKDWFYASGFPLTMQPLNYACVGDYAYMPKLRTGHPQVRDMILDVMLHWIRRAGIDGWRLDVADEVDGCTWHFIRMRLKDAYPDALLLGETWGDAARLVADGTQMDSAMNYLFRSAMVDGFAKRRLTVSQLDERLQRMLMKYPDAINLGMYNCLGSHDTPRFLTEADGDVQRVKLAVAFQMLFPGSPAIYYGDEVGMAGYNDPDCRAGMIWRQQDQNLQLLAWHRQLIALRQKSAALRLGDFRTCVCDDARMLYGFNRTLAGETVTALFNCGSQMQSVDIGSSGRAVDLLAGNTLDLTDGRQTAPVPVPPYSVKIIQIWEEEDNA
ncbi:MAG: glycoside hydrolase family 13 protein [Oscillospiraceae bacterium]|jgi:glycosidase|nr:glycoside hydrolase family 13 protein [Oscillospiraceae bacterium]